MIMPCFRMLSAASKLYQYVAGGEEDPDPGGAHALPPVTSDITLDKGPSKEWNFSGKTSR